MLRIAVVDDEQVHRDILVRYIEEWRSQGHPEVKVQVFDSSEAFYCLYNGVKTLALRRNL